MSTSTTTTTRERALELLGNGVGIESTALALGVTPSAITQLMAQEDFASEVTALKFKNLARHSKRDAIADDLEETILEKLKGSMEYIFKPMELLKAYQVVNAAKRRGVASQEGIASQAQVVRLIVPQITLQQFTSNTHNQVVVAGSQNLTTMQSGSLLRKLKEINNEPIPQDHGPGTFPAAALIAREEGSQVGRNSPIPAGAE